MERLKARGVGQAFVTLHVGAGTFLPVKAERIEDHRMHAEWGDIPQAVVERILAAKQKGGRIVAVKSDLAHKFTHVASQKMGGSVASGDGGADDEEVEGDEEADAGDLTPTQIKLKAAALLGVGIALITLFRYEANGRPRLTHCC